MILVFKTNIEDSHTLEIVDEHLNKNSEINSWNIDHWDIDKVLRIESHVDCSENIIQCLTELGIFCAQLED